MIVCNLPILWSSEAGKTGENLVVAREKWRAIKGNTFSERGRGLGLVAEAGVR
jgi:hypothetical protein